MGKGENPVNQHFLLSTQCFQKCFSPHGYQNTGLFGKRFTINTGNILYFYEGDCGETMMCRCDPGYHGDVCKPTNQYPNYMKEEFPLADSADAIPNVIPFLDSFISGKFVISEGSNPLLTLYSIDTHQQQTAFENIVGKGEIAHNEQFRLFPHCFLFNQMTVSPFVHIFDITFLFAAVLEESKIGIQGKGLTFPRLQLLGSSKLKEFVGDSFKFRILLLCMFYFQH